MSVNILIKRRLELNKSNEFMDVGPWHSMHDLYIILTLEGKEPPPPPIF